MMYVSLGNSDSFPGDYLISVDDLGLLWFNYKDGRKVDASHMKDALLQYLSTGTWKIVPNDKAKKFLTPPTMLEELNRLYEATVTIRNYGDDGVIKSGNEYQISTPTTNTKWLLEVFMFLNKAVDRYGFMIKVTQNKDYAFSLWGNNG